MSESNYWSKVLESRISRRRAIAATGGLTAGAALLAACGGGGSDNKSDSTSNTSQKVTDPTQGKPGGKLVWQSYGDPGGGLEMIKTRNAGVQGNTGGLIFDGLLEFAYGTPAKPGITFDMTPVLATALPEISPDKLTVTFKMRTGVNFQNGRALTSDDAKWTFDTLAFDAASAFKNDYAFIESTQAPDATTFVIKTKAPYADVVTSIAFKNHGAIMAKEFQLGPDADKKMMGSGPYTFVEYSPPLITRYAKNLNYWNKPYPYFDSIDRLGTSDQEKKIADFTSKQTHVTYWFSPEEATRVKAARPDAQLWKYPQAGAGTVYFRADLKPWDDARVRRAMSMAVDRKALLAAITGGEGGPDQALSWSGQAWEFRKPEELGSAAKYFELNLTEAKAQLQAAGVTLPLKFDMPTWNATVIGQKHVDHATLVTTQWRNAGIADVKLVEETFGQFANKFTGAGYDNAQWGPNVTATTPTLGNDIKAKYAVGADGTVKAPTLNVGYVTDKTIADLADKQSQAFDRAARIALFRQMEDKLAGDMWHVVGVVGTQSYFGDGSLKNAQMPRDAYNGANPWMKYWWFDKT